jgi:hypothetical protein
MDRGIQENGFRTTRGAFRACDLLNHAEFRLILLVVVGCRRVERCLQISIAESSNERTDPGPSDGAPG